MAREGKQVYRAVRNYTVNELGIGRDEIEQWTKEAVTARVDKVLNGIDFRYLVTETARPKVEAYVRSQLRYDVAKELAERIIIDIAERAPETPGGKAE